jgi:ferredoxin
MAKRKIIKIDTDKCNGCGLCIPNCPEGAIQIIDGKARLISDLFCDGLGACLGHCPQGAISTEEREAAPYDEGKVMENIVRQGTNTIRAHLKHLKEHNEQGLLQQAEEFLKAKGITVTPKQERGELPCGCAGTLVKDFRQDKPAQENKPSPKQDSQLGQWPVQIKLVPAFAPYLNNSHLLIAADCVPFAYADFHQDLLKGKTLLVGCPKLDDLEAYQQKITQVFQVNNIRSVTYAHMEVPCCFGLIAAIKSAILASGKNIPFEDVTISIKGEKLK